MPENILTIFFSFLQTMVKYAEDVIVFKSNINSAMKNQIPWNILVSLMNELCSTFEKSKEVNHVLLDELKIYKPGDQTALDEKIHDNPINVCNVKLEEQDGNKDLDLIKDEGIFPDNLKHEPYYEGDDFKEEDLNSDDEDYSPGEDNGEAIQECDQCDKTFKVRQSLLRHKRDKHGEKKDMEVKSNR